MLLVIIRTPKHACNMPEAAHTPQRWLETTALFYYWPAWNAVRMRMLWLLVTCGCVSRLMLIGSTSSRASKASRVSRGPTATGMYRLSLLLHSQSRENKTNSLNCSNRLSFNTEIFFYSFFSAAVPYSVETVASIKVILVQWFFWLLK